MYSLLEVKIELFDNGKGRMIQRTDIFSSCVYAGEFGGGSIRASKSGSRGGGSREWRHSGVSYGMKKITTEFVSSIG